VPTFAEKLEKAVADLIPGHSVVLAAPRWTGNPRQDAAMATRQWGEGRADRPPRASPIDKYRRACRQPDGCNLPSAPPWHRPGVALTRRGRYRGDGAPGDCKWKQNIRLRDSIADIALPQVLTCPRESDVVRDARSK
jgi:hypothetical protein